MIFFLKIGQNFKDRGNLNQLLNLQFFCCYTLFMLIAMSFILVCNTVKKNCLKMEMNISETMFTNNYKYQ